MKLDYYQDTDTLYIELRDADVAETKDFDENTILDMDDSGNVLAITFEHASERLNLTELVVNNLPTKKIVMKFDGDMSNTR